MALITCPECGHQVSDQAETCPNCGIKIAGSVSPAMQQPVQQTVQQANDLQPENTGVSSGNGNNGYGSTNAGQPNKNKNKNLILLLSFIIALVMCIIGYYIWNSATSEREEQQRYEEAMMSTNIQELKDYLVHFNDAPQEHRDSVTTRLAILTQEDTDWTNAVASGSKNALAEFIKTHPKSFHKGEAENLIDSIDYSIALSKNTADAFAEYLRLHPDSKRAAEAQQQLDDKRNSEVQPEEATLAKAVCRKFFQAINSKDEQKLLSTVTDVMSSFLGKSNADKSTAVAFMEKLYKEDITNMNWHILDDFKVEKTGSDTEGAAPNLKAQFSAEQKIERTDDTKEKYAKYFITAEVTPEGRITKLNMKKLAN